ncbi:hypothetical protein D3C86_1683870 [compost metagenome]
MHEEYTHIDDRREAEQIVDEQAVAYFCCNKEKGEGENDFNAIESKVAVLIKERHDWICFAN